MLPLGALLFLLYGMYLVSCGVQSPTLLRCRRLLIFFAALLSLMAALQLPLPWGLDLSALGATPWMALADGESRVFERANALGLLLFAFLIWRIEAPMSRWNDSLLHVLLLALLCYFSIAHLLSLSGSDLVVYFQNHVGRFQAVVATEFLTLGLLLDWLARRAQTAQGEVGSAGRSSFRNASLLLVGLLLLGNLVYLRTTRQLEPQHLDYLDSAFRLQVRQANQALAQAVGLADRLVTAVPSGLDEPGRLNRMIRREVLAIRLWDAQGRLVAQAGLPATGATFDQDLGEGRRLIWSEGAVLRLERPVLRASGALGGRVVFDLRMPALDGVLMATEAFGPDVETLICVAHDVNHARCLPSRLRQAAVLLERTSASGAAMFAALEGKSGQVRARNANGVPVFVVHGALAPYRLGLISTVPLSMLAKSNQGVFAAYFLLALVELLAISWFWRAALPARAATS
jgi:hypothetical protein